MPSDITTEHGQFETEAEAMALATAAGLTPLALDLECSGEDHWHDFGATAYLVKGSMTVTEVATGERCELIAGSTISAGSHVVHREEGEPYRAVVGFACDPAILTTPIDKSPADLPS